MSKIKTVIVVLLLVLAAGGSAFYGLTRFYQTEILPNTDKSLAGSEKLILDKLRAEAFIQIQALNAHSRDSALVDFLTQLPSTDGQAPDAMKSTLEPVAKKLQEPMEKIRASIKAEKLSILNEKGMEIVKVPGGLSLKSIEGLPIVKDCLSGTMRDGMYELDGKLSQLAAVPITNASGKAIGCLMSSQALGKARLHVLSKNSGHDLALLLRKKVQATTLDKSVSAALAASSKVGNFKFGTPSGKLPLLIDLKNKAYTAHVISIPGGTDPVLLAVVQNRGDTLAPLQQAQMMIIYATGGLFVFGLLLGLILSGGGTNKEFERLRDSVRFMADGNGNIIDPENYSGSYRELARDLKRLAEAARPVTHPGALSSSSENISDVLGKPNDLDSDMGSISSSEAGGLDFESLLDDSGPSSQPPAPTQPPVSAPPQPSPASPGLVPVSAAPTPSAPPMTGPAGQKGPKVDMPGDLASFFDEGVQEEMDQEVTKDASYLQVPGVSSPPPAAPVAPAPTPPAASNVSQSPAPFPPNLDDGENDDMDEEDSEYRPDATVIAQVPDELLKAAATASKDDAPMSSSSVPPPPTTLPKPPVARPTHMSPEESHFRDVFEDFIKTKKQCGESISGLTVEKFVDKLKKNSADLKSRYSCKSVTFQVYIKNGKAALKATPIK